MYLRCAAVDDDEMRSVGELAGSASGGVDEGADVTVRGLGLGHGVAVLDKATQPARQHLVHGGEVVGPLESLDDESPILGLARHAVLEDDHRPDDVGSLDVGDVVGLHPQRGAVQTEGLLDLLQGSGSSGQVGGSLQFVLGEGFLGVAGDGVHEGRLVTSTGNTDLDVGAALGAEDRGHDVGIRGIGGDEHQWRDGIAMTVITNLTVTGIDAVELGEEGLHQLGLVGVVGTVCHPASLTTDATAANVEDLDAHLQRVDGHRDDVGVSPVTEDDGIALQSL